MNRSLSSSIFIIYSHFSFLNLASVGGVYEKHKISLAEGVSLFYKQQREFTAG